MRTALAIAGLAILFTSPVLAQSAAEKTGGQLGHGRYSKDRGRVTEVASSTCSKSDPASLPSNAPQDAATKTFAQQMISDHMKTSRS